MIALLLTSTLALAAGPTITAAAGTGTKGYSGDGGPATVAHLDSPFDVTFDPAGNLCFSDTFNHCIRKIDKDSGVISTIAGNGKKGYTGDGGPATRATMNEPYGIEFDKEGNLYIVDRLNFCIRKVSSSGVISTIAGTGKSGYSGDGGPAHKAEFVEPNGIALDHKAGRLYIADVRGQRLRAIDLKSGLISTYCGTGKRADEGDGGPFQKASLNGPRAVAVGPDGKIYIVEREGNCVRRIDPATAKIDRYAGTGKKGYTGDSGPALKATFDGPKEIDIDEQGNVFVVDTENEAIRRIDSMTGVVTTVAGKGSSKMPGRGDGGPATAAYLGRPHGVVVDKDGTLYIGDTLSHRIRKVK